MRRLHGGHHLQIGQPLHIPGQEVLQVLQAVSPSLRQRSEFRARLFEDVERRMDGRIADGVDAHGEALFGCGKHVASHDLGIYRGSAAIAFDVRVRVRFGHPGGMLARHAVEELLETGCLQARTV